MKIAFLRSSGIYDDSRATKELMALLEEGYIIDVYGWDRTGCSVERVESVFAAYKDKISFHFYTGETGSNVAKKILIRYKWAKWLYKNLLKNKPYSLIHSCDYDTGEIAYKYFKKYSVRYIYDIYDYYIDAHPVPSMLCGYFEKREIKVINNSVLTIICTEERREQIKKSKPSQLLVIHNAPDINVIPNKEIKYDYVYCGGLNGRRLLTEILSLYPQNDDLHFVFGGNGALVPELEQLRSNYSNFDFLGSISYDAVLDYEAQSYIISAIYDPRYRNHKLCAPNKFYEALALGKPLIVCRGTGIDKIVEENRIGIVIDYDAEQFYEAVRKLLSNKDEMKRMGQRARTIYENNYKWSYMKDKLINEYRNITKKLSGIV